MILPPLRSTLFPYTTLFRSRQFEQAIRERVKRACPVRRGLAEGDRAQQESVVRRQTGRADQRHRVARGERLLDVRELRLHHLLDRKSTRLNSSHTVISYAVF